MNSGPVQLPPLVVALREAGARFAYLHGSRSTGRAYPDSDTDVGAHFGGRAPRPWDVPLPDGVDLVVLDAAPLYLAGRIALRGQLILDDDPPARVRWESETRVRYLEELPFIQADSREYLAALGRRGRP